MTPLIQTYADRLRAIGRSPYTIGARVRVLRRLDRILPHGLDHASGDELAGILANCRTDWTRSGYYSHIKGYYSTMVAIGKLDYDPTTSIDRPRDGDSTPNPVTDDELAIALDRSPDQPWRTAILLGAYQGLRCGEAARLLRSDVTEERVHVRRGKGGKARFIPTHPLVWEHVNRMPAGPVVRGKTGLGVSPEWLTGSQHRHWPKLGLENVHLHRFRHWFGTTLVDQGVGIEVVCELMGHASVATTQGYVKVAQSRRQAAIRALPVVAPEPDRSRLGHLVDIVSFDGTPR